MLNGIAHIVWNAALAALAVALALALVRVARAHRERGDRLLAAPLVALAVTWLLFLPNTCYLFTEVRHLFEAIETRELWSRASSSSSARFSLAARGLVAVLYAAIGALTFGLAIRPVRELAEERGLRTTWALPLFFVIVALGVYLGLVLRLNSWDAAMRPARVVDGVLGVTTSGPRRFAALVLSGLSLWAVYAVVDVWLDGATLRLERFAGWARVRLRR